MFIANYNEGVVLKVSQQKRDALAEFYRGIELRAYRMAEIETRSSSEAMDLVQDAMMALMQKYTSRPEEEWRPLFYRILQNKIRDWQRRGNVRNRILGFFTNFSQDEESIEPQAPSEIASPEQQLMQDISIEQLEVALSHLSSRQRQVFLLRKWEGFNVAETASIMGCSDGTVKTHLSRALVILRQQLEA
jgi:RNA polymerase sigma-70 factor (ECF subfamily)